MTSSSRRLLFWGALLAGTGVALGAFGAHALKTRLSPKDLAIFETGVRYQMFHALALLALAGVHRPDLDLSGVGRALVAGTWIFSGSLYLLVLTQTRWLGAITPIGGTTWILAWARLAYLARQESSEDPSALP